MPTIYGNAALENACGEGLELGIKLGQSFSEPQADPCCRCRLRRTLRRAVSGLVLAAGIALDLFIAHKFGVI